jgi:hypothetical protein
MEAVRTSETVYFNEIAWRYISQKATGIFIPYVVETF